jgi:peptidyl-prolyl cis-trans isomerase SurA
MSFTSGTISPSYSKISLFVFFLLCGYSVVAQESMDKIITIVGRNRIILQSELETEFAMAREKDPKINDSAKCLMLQQMILRKMLLEQAERDSVIVQDEDVEGQLDNRLRYYVQAYGSKEKLESVTGKSLYQIKEESREAIKEQMTAEKLQGTIMENVKITPAEVENFYKKIPVDSLPYFPATVEVGQIVIDPPVSHEMEAYSHQKLADIRKDIVEGRKTFENAAGLYSDDPGSRDNGGRYDNVTRNGPMAPEFISAAFKLQNGEISPIFKTKFGYHIIQMVNRKGDEADLRHILVKAEITTADLNASLHKLDSIRTLLVAGKLAFPQAVGYFSTDEAAKRTGGMIADPQTGNSELDMTKLDAGMVLMLDTLQPGQYSAPHIFYTEARDRSCRFVYLRSRSTPHRANMKDDYSRIQEVALAQKKNLKMMNWVNSKLPSYYIKISNEYQNCPQLKSWRSATDTANK